LASPFLFDGWALPEPWGVWSQAGKVSLRFPRPLLGLGPVTVEFDVDVFLAPKHGVERQRIVIRANGTRLEEYSLARAGRLKVTIHEGILERDAHWLILDLDLPDRVSPNALGLSGDRRDLALGLKSVVLQRHLRPRLP